MTEFETGLLAGLISGLLSSIMMLVFGAYWRDTLRPWVEDFIYRGARIGGVWKCEVQVAGQKMDQHVVIKQHAHRIHGTIAYPKDTTGRSHTYVFTGVFFNNVLTALAEEIGVARFDRGALMLALEPGFGEMRGFGLWLDAGVIVHLGYTWCLEHVTH